MTNMKNKIITITTLLAAMVAMTGIAAANPGVISVPSTILIDSTGVAVATTEIQVTEHNTIEVDRLTVEIYKDTDKDFIKDPTETPSTDLKVAWYGQALAQTNTQTMEPIVWKSVTVGSTETVYKIDLKLQNVAGVAGDQYYLKIWASNATSGYVSGDAIAQQHSEGINIPEFPTVALPVAAAIGLVFFFHHRKRKEEE